MMSPLQEKTAPDDPNVGARTTSLTTMSTGNRMNDVGFASACCIIMGAFCSSTYLLFDFKLVDCLQMLYIAAVGCAMAVDDTPFLKTIRAVVDAKTYLCKYAQFVTRLTGKGVTLIFLGSALFMSMWDAVDSMFMKFLAILFCAFPTTVGFFCVAIGVLKSAKLDRARRKLQTVVEEKYDDFSRTYPGPSGGLTMAEFNMATLEHGGLKFEPLDLRLIFRALVSNPTWASSPVSAEGGYTNLNSDLKLPKSDLIDWVRGGMVFL